jgi:hypothetical protein
LTSWRSLNHHFLYSAQVMLASHELADFQRIEKLPSWRELGDQKFSVLLASILELFLHTQSRVEQVLLVSLLTTPAGQVEYPPQ